MDLDIFSMAESYYGVDSNEIMSNHVVLVISTCFFPMTNACLFILSSGKFLNSVGCSNTSSTFADCAFTQSQEGHSLPFRRESGAVIV